MNTSQQIASLIRESLLNQVFDARTLAEIAAARTALRSWLETHPQEPGMADAFEILSS